LTKEPRRNFAIQPILDKTKTDLEISDADTQTILDAEAESISINFELGMLWDKVNSPTCGIKREQKVYSGCGYTYQWENNCKIECGNCKAEPFIPIEKPDCETSTYPEQCHCTCGIRRTQEVYTGCGYVYQSKANRDLECGKKSTTSKFIPSERGATVDNGGLNYNPTCGD